MTAVFEHFLNYLSSLDWGYIITFILIAHLLNQSPVTTWISKWTSLNIKTRYRVLFIGILYGVIVYVVRGYTIQRIECLFQSFIFALVFHKLLVDRIFNSLKSKKPTSDDELV